MLGSIVLLLVAKEYSKQKHDEAMARLTQLKEEEVISESVAEGDDPVVSGNRLKADDTCLVTGKNTAEKTITLRNIKGVPLFQNTIFITLIFVIALIAFLYWFTNNYIRGTGW